ncbi:hypothetical protein J2X01_003663 [Arthrobacter ginsengisoli]|uniref:Uncharacterized protein n=1 Tax=Arthrobacter ginsengisoli TaxID=1356565 RepID=A0ABU1UGU6_9MICC|nr:hypothetical protein [Arthrobacter ginsengisoli]
MTDVINEATAESVVEPVPADAVDDPAGAAAE